MRAEFLTIPKEQIIAALHTAGIIHDKTALPTPINDNIPHNTEHPKHNADANKIRTTRAKRPLYKT